MRIRDIRALVARLQEHFAALARCVELDAVALVRQAREPEDAPRLPARPRAVRAAVRSNEKGAIVRRWLGKSSKI